MLHIYNYSFCIIINVLNIISNNTISTSHISTKDFAKQGYNTHYPTNNNYCTGLLQASL